MQKDDYEKLIAHIKEKFVGQTIQFPYYFQLDKNRFLDLMCHNCGYFFKIIGDQWDEVNNNIFCPLCKFETGKGNWTTPEQESKKQEQNEIGLQESLGNSLHIELDILFSKENVKNPYQIEGFPFQNEYIPETVKDISQIEIVCDNCMIKYAIYGSAYFCPNCGHYSFQKIFEDNIRKIKAKIDLTLRLTDESGNKDENILVSRSLIETSLNDCIVAFQFNNEHLFRKRFPRISIPFNLFQKIDEGNDFWKQHQIVGYIDILDSNELHRLKIYFQRRHLLSHTEGIVDTRYLTKTEDCSVQIGQRIVVIPEDIEGCLILMAKIFDNI